MYRPFVLFIAVIGIGCTTSVHHRAALASATLRSPTKQRISSYSGYTYTGIWQDSELRDTGAFTITVTGPGIVQGSADSKIGWGLGIINGWIEEKSPRHQNQDWLHLDITFNQKFGSRPCVADGAITWDHYIPSCTVAVDYPDGRKDHYQLFINSREAL